MKKNYKGDTSVFRKSRRKIGKHRKSLGPWSFAKVVCFSFAMFGQKSR
jgi:hypothetical protein